MVPILQQKGEYEFMIYHSNGKRTRRLWKFELFGKTIQIYTNAEWYYDARDIKKIILMNGEERPYEQSYLSESQNLKYNIIKIYFENTVILNTPWRYNYHPFGKCKLIASGKCIPFAVLSYSWNTIYVLLDFETVISLDYNSLDEKDQKTLYEGIRTVTPFYKSIPVKYYRKKLNELEIMDACRRYMSNMGDYFLIDDKESDISRNRLRYKYEKEWKQ